MSCCMHVVFVMYRFLFLPASSPFSMFFSMLSPPSFDFLHYCWFIASFFYTPSFDLSIVHNHLIEGDRPSTITYIPIKNWSVTVHDGCAADRLNPVTVATAAIGAAAASSIPRVSPPPIPLVLLFLLLSCPRRLHVIVLLQLFLVAFFYSPSVAA